MNGRDGNFEVYVMNVDGSGQVRLTNNPAWDGDPTWSPDGSQIAFQSFRDGNWEIYVMNADGSGQTNVTNHPASSVTQFEARLLVSSEKPAVTPVASSNLLSALMVT